MANMRQPWQVLQRDGAWILQSVNESGGSHGRYFGADEAAARAELERMRANGLCRECGDVLYDHFVDEVKAEILSRQLCHDCLHWTGYVETRSDPTHIVVAGKHYVIAPDMPEGHRGFVGHGGAEFAIRFKDGRPDVVSRNLWAQGVVPEWFRDRLPDSAEFVQRGHRKVGNWPGAGGYVGAGSADSNCF